MSWLFSKNEQTSFEWDVFSSSDQLEDYIQLSSEKLIVFFKHSTRCSISTMAKSRFERNWKYDSTQILPIYLDLIAHRDLSAKLADRFHVAHESPQILLIKNGECIYNTSHNMIDADQLEQFID